MNGFGEGVGSINSYIDEMSEMIKGTFSDSKGKMDNQFEDIIAKIKSLKNSDKIKEEASGLKDFNEKLTLWFKHCGIMFFKVILILYIPICWYLITRKGYSVGGTDLNNFPYRDPNTNKKSYNQISQLYKQSGGDAGGTFDILGPYRNVTIPYQGILDVEPEGFIPNIRLWGIDSFAGSISLLRFVLSFILAAGRDITGYDNNSSKNFLKFILAIPIGYFGVIMVTIFGMAIALFMNMLTLTIKIKDYWWPFAGTRLFSGTTWIFILMLFGLFAPYSSLIFLLITFLASTYTVIQHLGLWIFVFGAPFTYLYKQVNKNNYTEITHFIKSIMNAVFWVYMSFVLLYPTKIIWGSGAFTGGLLYLVYLLFTQGPNVFK